MNAGYTEQLSPQNIAQVKAIASKLVRAIGFAEHFDDLVQEGLIGLLNAKSRYSEEADASFETYASHRIKGAMLDHLRREDHLSRDLRQLMRQVQKARNKLEHAGHDAPSLAEIAQELDMDPDALNKEMSMATHHLVSYDQPELEGLAEEKHQSNLEMSDSADNLTLIAQMASKMDCLSEREQQVLVWRYWDDKTYRDIAKKLKVSPTLCAQLHESSLLKMRKAMSCQ